MDSINPPTFSLGTVPNVNNLESLLNIHQKNYRHPEGGGIKTACFLDFDHTLFNTDDFFHVDVRNSFLQLGIKEQLWEQSYATVWPKGYALEKHVEELNHQSGVQLPVEEIKQLLLNNFSDLKRYLFTDVLLFLENVKKKGIAIYLLSFGDQKWQKYKVHNSGLSCYFEDIFFTTKEGTKAEYIYKYSEIFQQIIMVDNNPAELDLIKDALPITRTYFIDRVPGEMRIPKDELTRLKFLEARNYIEKPQRHNHVAIKTLHDILFL